MKQRIILLSFLILVLGLTTLVNAGCPGLQYPEVEAEFSLSSSIECLFIDIDPSGCAPDSPLQLYIGNYECNRDIIYIDGKGLEHELSVGQKPGTPFVEEDIPQEIGAEYTRELYFKDSPNEKIILSVKNVPPTSNKDYTLYYILCAIVLIIIVVLAVLKFRKK